jgi:hypothetical protein
MLKFATKLARQFLEAPVVRIVGAVGKLKINIDAAIVVNVV